MWESGKPLSGNATRDLGLSCADGDLCVTACTCPTGREVPGQRPSPFSFSAADRVSLGREHANGGLEVLLFNHQVVGRRTGDPVDADMLAREGSGKRFHDTER